MPSPRPTASSSPATTSRCSACARASGRLLGRERRPRADGTSGRGAQPRLLAAPLRRRSGGRRPDDLARRRCRSRSSASRRPEFFGAEVGTSPSLFLPVMMQPAVMPMTGACSSDPQRARDWLRVLGRLKPGVAARAGRAPAQRAGGRRPRPSGGRGTSSRDSSRTLGSSCSSAATGLSDLRRQFSQPLFILLGVAGIVLLIACANVGQLVLARSAARRPEFALRLALGAGRGRVMRQVLVEGLVLDGDRCGSRRRARLLGRASAGAPTRRPARGAVVLDLSPDLRVLAFTAVVSIAAGLLFASAAGDSRLARRSLVAMRTVILAGPGMQRPSAGPGRPLVVAQVALSVVLLVGAGLFVRSLQNLHHHERGNRPRSRDRRALEPRGSGQRTRRDRGDASTAFIATCSPASRRSRACSRRASRATSPLGPSTLGFPVIAADRRRADAGGRHDRLSALFRDDGHSDCQGARLHRGRPAARRARRPSWSTRRSCASSSRGASRSASRTACRRRGPDARPYLVRR